MSTWKRTYENVPHFEKVDVKREMMDARNGPFGGGWTTKFALLVGTSRHVIHFWKWTVTLWKN